MKSLFTYLTVLLFSWVSVQGQWSTTQLSQIKSQMGATSYGSKAYFAGGLGVSSHSNLLEIYDPVTDEWETETLSAARSFPSLVAVGGKVMVAGGINFFNNLQELSTVDIYDTLTQTWSSANLSVPGYYLQSVAYEQTAIITGFYDFVSDVPLHMTFSNAVDMYDAASGNWSTDTLSQARGALSATVVGDIALFAGGLTSLTTTSNRVDIYHFKTGTWSIDSLSIARAFTAAVTVGNKAFFAGGTTTANTQSDVVDIYDYETGTWSTSQLSSPRSFTTNQGAVVCGKAFFAGGGTIDLPTSLFTDLSDVVDIYDPMSDSWSLDSLSKPIVNQSVTAVNNQVLLAGGAIRPSNEFVSTDSVEIYTCEETSTSNERFASGLDVQLFPNPSSDVVQLIVERADWSVRQVEIIDLNGRVVKALDIHERSALINVSELNPGSYALKVAREGQIAVKRLLIADQ